MPSYDIIITDVQSVSFSQTHPDIETAREATIRKAVDRMLDTPAARSPQTATCNVVEDGTLEERSCKVTLTIVDYI